MARLKRDDGVELYYEVHGDKEKPTILLTHGYSATSQMWKGQIEAFTQSYRLVTWDMRGHGQTDSPDDQKLYSEDATVADMAAILDAVEAEKAIIGGLSLGGYMSMAFRREHPERTLALLIIDTGPGYKSDEAREGWNKNALRTAERFETDGLESLKSRSAEMATSVHRSAAGLARAGRGMLTQRDSAVIHSLPAIMQPSIVIVGAEDGPFLNAADYMSAKIPGARKVVIPQAGHAVNIDQPEAFNKAVLDFLEPLAI